MNEVKYDFSHPKRNPGFGPGLHLFKELSDKHWVKWLAILNRDMVHLKASVTTAEVFGGEIDDDDSGDTRLTQSLVVAGNFSI